MCKRKWDQNSFFLWLSLVIDRFSSLRKAITFFRYDKSIYHFLDTCTPYTERVFLYFLHVFYVCVHVYECMYIYTSVCKSKLVAQVLCFNPLFFRNCIQVARRYSKFHNCWAISLTQCFPFKTKPSVAVLLMFVSHNSFSKFINLFGAFWFACICVYSLFCSSVQKHHFCLWGRQHINLSVFLRSYLS